MEELFQERDRRIQMPRKWKMCLDWRAELLMQEEDEEDVCDVDDE